MDQAGDCEKKTRAQRKRKVAAMLESVDNVKTEDPHTSDGFEDDTSDDLYVPPKDVQQSSSDDFDSDHKNSTKKLKTGMVDTEEENEHKSRSKGKVPLRKSRIKRKYVKRRNRRLLRVRKEFENDVELPVLRKRLQKPTTGPNSIIGKFYKVW